LVELLVVIGIIALLISILLPALSRARQAADKIACASNLHQIVIAMLGYNTEHNGAGFPFIPMSDIESGQPVTRTWYNQQTGFGASSTWTRDGMLSRWLGAGNVYECPTIKSLNLPLYYQGMLTTSYGLNTNLSISNLTNQAQVRQASQTIMFAESLAVLSSGIFEFSPYIAPPDGGTSGTASYQFIGRHGKQGNAAFFDGHVEGVIPILPPQSDISTGIISAANYPKLVALNMGMCVPKGIDVSKFTDQSSMSAYLASQNASYWFWVNKSTRQ